MKAAANYTGYGAPIYAKQGYLQIDDEHESVSKTLEYAYDDWCIAQVADRLGKDQDLVYYLKRSQSYKNLFDPSTGFPIIPANELTQAVFDFRNKITAAFQA